MSQVQGRPDVHLHGQVSSMLLDNAVLEFYKWDGEVKDMLAHVRDNLNEVAESWTREQKDRCLEETAKSFQVSSPPITSTGVLCGPRLKDIYLGR